MPPQTTNKPLEFNAGASSTFVMLLVSTLLYCIPLVGLALAFNYQIDWFAKNTKINGQTVSYKASVGETLVMLYVGILLICLTLGIYLFWFFPKVYRFITEHISIGDALPEVPSSATALPTTPAQPLAGPVAAPVEQPHDMATPVNDSQTSPGTPPANLVQ